MDPGSQYDLRPFPTVCGHFLPVVCSHYISIPLKLVPPSFTWSCPFLVPSTIAAAICCGIPRFCILSTWPYHPSRTDFIHITLSATSTSPLSSCLFLFSSVFLLLRVHIFSLLSSFHIFWARTFLPWFFYRPLTCKSVCMVLGFCAVLIWCSGTGVWMWRFVQYPVF